MPPRMYTFNAPTNPVLQVLYFLVGGVLLIGAVVMGAVILAFVFGFAVVLGIVIYIRVWWLKRKFEKSGRRPGGPAGDASSSRIFEVEYTVVDERNEQDDPSDRSGRGH